MAVAVPGLVAAACGGGDDADTSSATTQAMSVTSAAPVEVAEDEEYDLDATFRYSYFTGVTSFDPSKSSSGYDNAALFLVYDRLVHLDPNAQPIPGLATSWEFSEDGTALDLTLREDVTFHDGARFDAEVARLNLERARAGTSKGDLAPVSSIEVTGPYQLRLTFSSGGGAIPQILSDKAGAMVSPNAVDNPDLDLMPVGSGMYKVVEHQKGAKIVMERFEDYWDEDAAKVARFEFLTIPDENAAFNAIKAGDVDAGIIQPGHVADAKASGLNVTEGLTLVMTQMQLNRSRPFLDQEAVRRALNMAIDREALVEGIMLGHAAPAVQPFPEGYWAHNPEVSADHYPYDPVEASRLLREAGVPEGHTYELVVPSTGVLPALGAAVKDQLAEVGLNITLLPIDAVQTTATFFQQLRGDLLLTMWSGRADPAQTLNLLLTSGPLQNPGGHSTPELEALALEVTQPGTAEERSDPVHRMVRQALDQSMLVPLYHPATITASSQDVIGLQNWMGGKPEFRVVGLRAK